MVAVSRPPLGSAACLFCSVEMAARLSTSQKSEVRMTTRRVRPRLPVKPTMASGHIHSGEDEDEDGDEELMAEPIFSVTRHSSL